MGFGKPQFHQSRRVRSIRRLRADLVMSPSKTDNRVWEEPFQQIRQLLSDAEGAEKKVLLREIFEIVVNTETPEETAMRM